MAARCEFGHLPHECSIRLLFQAFDGEVLLDRTINTHEVPPRQFESESRPIVEDRAAGRCFRLTLSTADGRYTLHVEEFHMEEWHRTGSHG